MVRNARGRRWHARLEDRWKMHRLVGVLVSSTCGWQHLAKVLYIPASRQEIPRQPRGDSLGSCSCVASCCLWSKPDHNLLLYGARTTAIPRARCVHICSNPRTPPAREAPVVMLALDEAQRILLSSRVVAYADTGLGDSTESPLAIYSQHRKSPAAYVRECDVCS